MNRLRKTNRARRGSAPGRAAVVVGVLGVALGVASGAHSASLITGQQIKDGTVTGRDVRNGTVESIDVANASITADDYAGRLVGPPGPRGDQGRKGFSGVRLIGLASSPYVDLAPNAIKTQIAVCEQGQVAVGGGSQSKAGMHTQLLDSSPLSVEPNERRTWATRVRNNTNVSVSIATWAICAEVK